MDKREQTENPPDDGEPVLPEMREFVISDGFDLFGGKFCQQHVREQKLLSRGHSKGKRQRRLHQPHGTRSHAASDEAFFQARKRFSGRALEQLKPDENLKVTDAPEPKIKGSEE